MSASYRRQRGLLVVDCSRLPDGHLVMCKNRSCWIEPGLPGSGPGVCHTRCSASHPGFTRCNKRRLRRQRREEEGGWHEPWSMGSQGRYRLCAGYSGPSGQHCSHRRVRLSSALAVQFLGSAAVSRPGGLYRLHMWTPPTPPRAKYSDHNQVGLKLQTRDTPVVWVTSYGYLAYAPSAPRRPYR